MTERQRGIYLLPNLFTTLGLFAGFYAIIAAINGAFDTAALAVFIAGLMDGVDGRVARMTNTQSDFGAQYDSMTDLVAFGVAPALLIYLYALNQLGKFGWMLAFFYAAAAAMRLARFNVQAGVPEKEHFQGLGSPAAAGLVIATVWLGHDYQLGSTAFTLFAAVATLFSAALMVSNVRFYSLKVINLRERIPFVTGVFIIVALAIFATAPPVVLMAVSLTYAISGPVFTLVKIRQAKAKRKQAK
ncbi:MAG: CDP-diacylglycerol--serine O-phosphatidyltransferase [Gammaproteobacteria bacterium]|nr:MAG: CDP-diacylglycerol--serine O-phosphatidyltransferase [Gammaproteobacteria bacterium]RLA15121.1 MAG: CDP-diacylglycerol--serine O-phosphatidyltransferase [Gammaproteobacteria bacterium]